MTPRFFSCSEITIAMDQLIAGENQACGHFIDARVIVREWQRVSRRSTRRRI